MRVTPGEQPAPQSAEQPQEQQQGPSPQEALQMIQGGFEALGKIIEGAAGQLSPEDIQMFKSAAEATEVMIQSLTSSPGGEEEQPREEPGHAMAENESPRGAR